MNQYIIRFVATMLRLKDRVKPRPWLGLVAFCVLIAVIVFIEPALAQDPAQAQSIAKQEDADPGLFYYLMSLLASFFVTLARVCGLMIVYLIQVIIVPVMQYNEFSTSAVVGAGWAIVRDTVNIGFVIILLIMAFGTIIFGSEGDIGSRFDWRKNLPRLLVMAILINFSRTICGLMIDFGQVVMITFVNAIKDIAGGNFIELFGLADIMSLNADQIGKEVEAEDSAGLTMFWLLAAALMSLIMMLMVLLTLVGLMVILVYRIVILWILVVLSPIAFFFGGAQNVVKSQMGTSGGAYAEWWKSFSSAIVIGPVMAFFLWLALAVAGAGNIANEFVLSNSGDEFLDGEGNIPLEVFSMENFISYIIGLGLLWAGMDTAMKVASGFPGASQKMMKRFIGPKATASTLRGISGAAAKVGGKMARGGKKVVGGGVGLVGGGLVKGAKIAKPYAGQLKVPGTKTKIADYGIKAKELVRDEAKNFKGAGGIVGFAAGQVERGTRASLQKDYAKDRKDMSEQMSDLTGMNKDELMEVVRSDAYSDKDRARKRAAVMTMMSKKGVRGDMSAQEFKEARDIFEQDGGKDIIKGDSSMNKDYKTAQIGRSDTLSESEWNKLTSKKTDKEKADMIDGNAILKDPDGRVMDRIKDLSITHRGNTYNGQEYLEAFGRGDVKQAISEYESLEPSATARLTSAPYNLSADDAASELSARGTATKRYWANNEPSDLTAAGLAAEGGELSRVIAADTVNPKQTEFLRKIHQSKQQNESFLEGTKDENLAGYAPDQVDAIKASSYFTSQKPNLGHLGSAGGQRQSRIGQIKRIDTAGISRVASQLNNKITRQRGSIAKNDSNELFRDLFSQIDAAYLGDLSTEYASGSDERKEEIKETAKRLVTSINVAQIKKLSNAQTTQINTLKSDLRSVIRSMT